MYASQFSNMVDSAMCAHDHKFAFCITDQTQAVRQRVRFDVKAGCARFKWKHGNLQTEVFGPKVV
jgi:hypothetical protein